jgi:hypothetical protein
MASTLQARTASAGSYPRGAPGASGPSTNMTSSSSNDATARPDMWVAEALMDVLLAEAALFVTLDAPAVGAHPGQQQDPGQRAYTRMEALGYRVGFALVEKYVGMLASARQVASS